MWSCDEIREMAGAGQRLPDLRGGGPPWELTAEWVRLICDPHFGVGPMGSCCFRSPPPTRTLPICGSSIRMAPRPSYRATAPARRCSICGGRADGRRRVHDRHRGRADHAHDRRRAHLHSGDGAGGDHLHDYFPGGPEDGAASSRPMGAPGASSTYRSATRSARSRWLKGSRSSTCRRSARRSRATSCSRTAPTSRFTAWPRSGRSAAGSGRGSSSEAWGRLRLGHRRERRGHRSCIERRGQPGHDRAGRRRAGRSRSATSRTCG